MPPEIRTLMLAHGLEPDDVMNWEIRGGVDDLTELEVTMLPKSGRVRLELTVALEDDQ